MVWSYLGRIRPGDRLSLYTKWRDLYEDVHILRLVKLVTEHDVKVLMGALTKETINSAGKSIALLAATNPLIVWKPLLECIFEKDSLVPLVVELVTTISDSFSQDALAFVIFDLFKNSKRPRFKRDGFSHEGWFSSLSTLTASLFGKSGKFSETWLSEYLEILAQCLKTSSAELLPLSTLLTCMSGIEPISEHSDAQIEAFGGSKGLIREFLFPTDSMSIRGYTLDTRVSSGEGEERLARKVFLLPDSFDPLHHLLETLCCNDLSERILKAIFNYQYPDDLSFLWCCRSMDWQDKSTIVLRQLCLIVKLGTVKFPRMMVKGFISSIEHWRSFSMSFAIYMDIGRLYLRSYLESRSLNFVRDFEHADDERPEGVHIDVFALFWALELYDLYVPGPRYLRETERISALTGDEEDLPQFFANRTHMVESLKASYEEHVSHVAWILNSLPMFKVSTSAADDILHDILHVMIIPRAVRSKLDARYAFCFLCYTCDDPFSLLEMLFDCEMLKEEMSFLSELDVKGFAHFLNEIWQDVCAWSSLDAGDTQRLALCKGIREQVAGTLGNSRRGDDGSGVRADDSAVPGTDAGSRYSLFRPHRGRKLGEYMQRWSRNLSGAITNFVLTHVEENHTTALILATNTPDIVMYSFKGRDLTENYLPYLLRELPLKPKITKLVKDLISVYNERKRDKGVSIESNTEGDSRHEQQTQKGDSGEAGSRKGHEKVNGRNDSVDDAAIVHPGEKRSAEEVAHESKRPCTGK